MKKFIVAGVFLAILIAAAVLIYKLISGAIGIISALLHAVIAIAIIVALAAIVVWMFKYAAKKK